MTTVHQTDALVVLNGPEDGTEFPIVRTPLHLGSDPSCHVYLRLDTSIQPRHLLITVVSDGYRVRSLDMPTATVNGKPAGPIRSRILRPGGQLQVGRTLLTVRCAPDGLAKRSRGLPHESDLGWAVRRAVLGLGQRAARLGWWGWERLKGLATSGKTILLLLVVLYLFWGPFRSRVNSAGRHIYHQIILPLAEQIQGLLG